MSITRHEVSATMVNPTLDLKPTSAQITLDEAWSPYARATLVCPIPPGTLITQIDPRQGDRVTIVVTRTNVQTSAVQTRTFNLGLRGCTIDYLNGTMTLDLAGDELRLQDFLRYETVYATLNPPATGSLVTLVNWGLGIVFPGTSLALGAIEAGIDPTKIVFKAGDPMWGFLDAFVRGTGLRLWCDEARIWHLDAPLRGAGGLTLPGVTMMNHTLTREPWADAVVIENSWTTATGDAWTVSQSAYTSAPGGPTKGFILRNTASTAPSVAAAVELYYRMQGRGRDLTVKAVSDYTVTPGLIVAMNVPNASYSAMVSSVSWDLPSDEMTITTRDRPALLRAGGDVLTALDTTYTPNPTDPPATAGPGAQPKELEP